MTPTGRSHNIRAELAAAAGDQFEILREIGRGGMGWVFLARDLRLNRRVALKVLSPRLLMEDGMGARFLREAQILASLRHANVVGVHSVHHAGDLHFFAMDFIDGPPLDYVLGVKGQLSYAAIRAIAFMVGSALDYGHHRGRGVIHRDIKPANVLLDAGGSVVVTDFGISKVLQGSPRLTRTGVVMGTPEYMSPEQCTGGAITEASDQYSMGALLYRMLCGSAPFGGTTVEVLFGHVHRPPDPIRANRPDCPRDLGAAVERMLEKDPSDRFADIAEAIAAMGAAPVGLRSEARRELAELAQLSVSDTGAIDISSPLSPVREVRRGSEVENAFEVTPATKGAVTSLFIGSPAERVHAGESTPIWIDARDADGHAVPDASVRLSVDNPEIASLDESGVLVAQRPGIVTVTAVTGEIEQHFTVEIVDSPRPSRVLVEPLEVTLKVGQSIRMAATVLDGKGAKMTDEPVEWAVDGREVFELEGDVLHARRPGTGRVTATAGLVSASIEATALSAPAAIVFDGARASCRVGDTFQVTPLVIDAEGGPIEGLEIMWRTSDRSVVVVDLSGRVRAEGAGSAHVEAVHGAILASFEIEVTPALSPASEVWAAVSPVGVTTEAEEAPTTAASPNELGALQGVPESSASGGKPFLLAAWRRAAVASAGVAAIALIGWLVWGGAEAPAISGVDRAPESPIVQDGGGPGAGAGAGTDTAAQDRGLARLPDDASDVDQGAAGPPTNAQTDMASPVEDLQSAARPGVNVPADSRDRAPADDETAGGAVQESEVEPTAAHPEADATPGEAPATQATPSLDTVSTPLPQEPGTLTTFIAGGGYHQVGDSTVVVLEQEWALPPGEYRVHLYTDTTLVDQIIVIRSGERVTVQYPPGGIEDP